MPPVPAGAEIAIYKSPVKTSDIRVRVLLDRMRATTNFVDEFSGSSLDPALWSSWRPNEFSDINVSGGSVNLRTTSPTNAFPYIWSKPGITFPQDRTIGWTLEATFEFPVVTGFGVFFQVVDLENADPIFGVECNAIGTTVQFPWLNIVNNISSGSHSYELIYDPSGPTYELKVDGGSEGTIDATDRTAWIIVGGNGSIQVHEGAWTELAISRVDVNLVSNESQNYPDWTATETIDSQTWGILPTVIQYQEGTHERNDVDQCTVTLSFAGWVDTEYRHDLYAGFEWSNRELRIEQRQRDGTTWTAWKETMRCLVGEASIGVEAGEKTLQLTCRDKWRAILQASHLIAGYADAPDPIPGVKQGFSAPDIILDVAAIAGGGNVEIEVHADILAQEPAITPRNWQLLGTGALEGIVEIAEDIVARVIRRPFHADKGSILVDNYRWEGTESVSFDLAEDIISIEEVESTYGQIAQVLENVQHSEFAEFTEVHPKAPIPPLGARLSHNSRVAKVANDINGRYGQPGEIDGVSRRLAHLRWLAENRELHSIVIGVVGQDWIDHGIEVQIIDDTVLNITDKRWIVVGWEYAWTANDGLRTNIHLIDKAFPYAIMRSSNPYGAVVVGNNPTSTARPELPGLAAAATGTHT